MTARRGAPDPDPEPNALLNFIALIVLLVTLFVLSGVAYIASHP